ncbi:D-glucuronyl C5-epimerase family protein [Helcobacillus massiliensis]|uniref:D-glucuronyl C5-epimerase family protein n=1 Tax=Helcobacillus TaxID=1161125 RepID=UPI001EF69F36|nr:MULTISPECIES: D-glucuronyl C5-epimerase family protein [Helcobacillus]MCG7426674.1 D-glucuronyl C5-epimerase family protein [Helcobacillus sp. ACRRO]MCT1557634.1 D-glucuronyl C5-epimerase family protein [Helcobacillus massiliensis]MCT2035906.1 D-glucuronyl C5-epimerase family protein [Helcobacillus massiliensis]MCT2331824.1 D-glucuronyl C5-epimerase family protein [Helcobacillus massiliensis]
MNADRVSSDDVTNEADVGFPSLSSARRAVWDYYRIEFLPDGYPGRRTDGELFAHPIYGSYVISDYLAQFRTTGEQQFFDAACAVADAAISRMSPIGEDAIAFIYDQENTKVSTVEGSWYSGLTQARYVDVLSRLLHLPGTERFSDPMAAILRSLAVPVAEGGVAHRTASGGLQIEEYPSAAPDCTLNGWTTATAILHRYAKSSGDGLAWELFHDSVQGLEDLVPLYDFADLATSRYRLKGPAEVTVRTRGAAVTVHGVEVRMPGFGTFDASTTQAPAGGWAANELPKRIAAGSEARVHLSLSRATFPVVNTVVLDLEADGDAEMDILMGDGPYDPLRTYPRFAPAAMLHTGPVIAGRQTLEVEVPWDRAEIVSYPTNFGKAIAGRQFNQYHWIHVDTLTTIAEASGSAMLRYYADRWREQPKKWPTHAGYQDPSITLERFDPALHR